MYGVTDEVGERVDGLANLRPIPRGGWGTRRKSSPNRQNSKKAVENGDGDLDLAVANHDSDNVSVLLSGCIP